MTFGATLAANRNDAGVAIFQDRLGNTNYMIAVLTEYKYPSSEDRNLKRLELWRSL